MMAELTGNDIARQMTHGRKGTFSHLFALMMVDGLFSKRQEQEKF